jgi:hypothetical protein
MVVVGDETPNSNLWRVFGKSGDTSLYSSSGSQDLNIINGTGSGTTDNINFFAGYIAPITNQTPDLHIHGSGTTKGYVGIGTSTPSERLDVVGTNGIFYSKLDDTEVQLQLSAQTTSGVTNISTSSPNAGSLLMGIRGIDNTSSPGFGNQGDSFIYSSIDNNGLNIISQKGFPQTKDDYIRFYAGQLATTGNTPDLYIQGSGSTRGYVGINNDSPTEQLDVSGNTKISEDLFVGDTVYIGNVTGTPTTNASLYITQPSITGSTESPIIDIQVDDANSYFRINNATATDGFFTPSIETRQSDDSGRLSFYLDSVVSPTYDTPGALDVVRFRARRDSDFIQNRDLFSWYNYTTRLMDMDKDGNLNIIQGGLRINTLGTGTSVNNLGIDSSGNVVSGITGNLLYSQTNNYTLGVPITINHNLNTTDVLVQIVDTNTNELIYGTVDNYQSNSLDVTLSTTINNIKVLVIGSSVSQVVPKGSIVYTLGHDSISPTDNNDYFIGQNFNLTPSTSSNDGRRFIVQKTGTVTQVSIKRTITGTLGSSETNSFYVNNVTQATQGFITSGETFDSSSSLTNYTLSTPLNVTAGDKLEIEWFTPAWVTNPTSVRQVFNMIIEY